MSEKIRVIHYINQFYAGMGGEDTASVGVSVKEEPVGPGTSSEKTSGRTLRDCSNDYLRR
ncbi:MAG: glycine/sarcosine/betaine reductase selenoprotein B family protein [Faecalimonas umbilicata]